MATIRALKGVKLAPVIDALLAAGKIQALFELLIEYEGLLWIQSSVCRASTDSTEVRMCPCPSLDLRMLKRRYEDLDRDLRLRLAQAATAIDWPQDPEWCFVLLDNAQVRSSQTFLCVLAPNVYR